MNDERRQFMHRVMWLIVPGLISGLITGAVSYGIITTTIRYVQRDIIRIEKKVNEHGTEIVNLRIRMAEQENR